MMRTARTCLVVWFAGILLRNALAGWPKDLDWTNGLKPIDRPQEE